MKLNDIGFNALTEFVRRPILENIKTSKKRILIKNKFDPTKSVHFI